MRIAFVSPWAGSAFGTEKMVDTSVRLLEAAGHQCQVFAAEWRSPRALPANHQVIEGASGLSWRSSPLQISHVRRAFLKQLAEFSPDVVHFVESIDSSLLSAAADGYPCLVAAHSVALSCPASHRTPLSGPVCEIRSSWQCWLHHRRLGCLSEFKGGLRRLQIVAHQQRKLTLLRKKFHLIAVSRYLQRTFIAEGWPAERVHLIYNPVTSPAVTPCPDPQRPPIILFAARHSRLKGLPLLIEALGQIQDRAWELIVMGQTAEESQLHARLQALGIRARVTFLGHLAHQAVADWMARATFLVQTNVGPEGFGLSVAEAGALGLPVLVTNVPALNEIIEDEVTGLVSPPQAFAIADRMKRLLSDPSLRKMLGDAAKKRTAQFSEAQHLDATLNAYARAQNDCPSS